MDTLPTGAEDFYSIDILVTNPRGLHVRPSTMLADICRKYDGRVIIKNEMLEADGSQILDLLMLAAQHNTHLTVLVSKDRPNYLDIAQKITEVFAKGFGET